jgi:outer membrane protein OmpA-like peptidoglycan-associated protein
MATGSRRLPKAALIALAAAGLADLLLLDLVLVPRHLEERERVAVAVVVHSPAPAPVPDVEPAPAPVPDVEPARPRPLPPPPPDLLFESESAELDRSARRSLWSVAWTLRRRPELTVLVRGHADPSGTEAANQALSRRRAEEAARFLVGQGGIDMSRVDVEAVGSREPVARRSSSRGLTRCRRVELVWRRSPATLGDRGGTLE